MSTFANPPPPRYDLTNQIRMNATLKARSGFYTDMVTFSMALIIMDIEVDMREDLMVSLKSERVFNQDFDEKQGRFRKLPYTLHYCQVCVEGGGGRQQMEH